MRLSYAVIYTPDQSQAKMLKTIVKHEARLLLQINLHLTFPNLIRRRNNNLRFGK